jgi:hypothetical protein
MDWVFNVEDADNELRNIVQYYPIFTTEQVVQHVRTYGDTTTPIYDDYDTDNLNDSALLLLNSIDSELKILLNPVLRVDVSGPELFMQIVSEIQRTSVEMLSKLAKHVEKVTLKSFKGENVKLYSAKIIQMCRDLESGQSLQRDIALTIIDQLGECYVEKFRL